MEYILNVDNCLKIIIFLGTGVAATLPFVFCRSRGLIRREILAGKVMCLMFFLLLGQAISTSKPYINTAIDNAVANGIQSGILTERPESYSHSTHYAYINDNIRR